MCIVSRPAPSSSDRRRHRHAVSCGAACLALVSLAGCNSMNGGVNNRVGMSSFQQGNYTMARDQFQRAAADDPYNADYVHNMAAAMRRQGDAAGAEQAYRRALAIDPGHQPSYHGLASLLKDEGRETEAVNLVQGWVDQQPYSSEPYIELAWLKRELGDIPGTEQLLQNALRVKPNDHIATAQLGQLYQDTNQPDRAVAMYKRSLYSNYYQPEVQSRVAQLQRQTAQRGYAAVPVYGPSGPTTAYYPVPPQQMAARPYPLPSYSHLAGQPPVSGMQPPLAAGPAVPIAPRTANSDPAHTGESLSAEIPVVAPY